MHYAIHKLHWTPSEIIEWLDADQSIQAFYYASTELKSKRDQEEADRIKRESNKK